MIGLMTVGGDGKGIARRCRLGAESNGQALRREVEVIDQGHAHNVECSRLQARHLHSRLVDRDCVYQRAVQPNFELERTLLLLLCGQCPVYNRAVGLDRGQIDTRGKRDIEAEEIGELVEGLIQDLGCAIDEPEWAAWSVLAGEESLRRARIPEQSDGDTDGLEPEG